MERQYKIGIGGSVPTGHPFPIISWLIRLLEWSDISHAFWDFPEEDKVFHAHFNDIKWQDKDEYYKTIERKHYFEIEVNEPVYKAIKSHLNSIQGLKKGYFLQLFGVAPAMLIRKIFGWHIGNPFTWHTSKTCTQVVAETSRLHLDGADKWFDDLGPSNENLTTQDIVEFGKFISKK